MYPTRTKLSMSAQTTWTSVFLQCGDYLTLANSREITHTFSLAVFKGDDQHLFLSFWAASTVIPDESSFDVIHLISGAPTPNIGHGPGGITPDHSHPALAVPSPRPGWPHGAWLVPAGCYAWLVRLPAHTGQWRSEAGIANSACSGWMDTPLWCNCPWPCDAFEGLQSDWCGGSHFEDHPAMQDFDVRGSEYRWKWWGARYRCFNKHTVQPLQMTWIQV